MTTPVASLGILASSILATGHLGQCSHASMRRALVHSCLGNNRLVRSSSPPSPTTQSCANGDFPVQCESPRTGGDLCTHFVSAICRLNCWDRFGAFVSAPQNRVSRRRRLALVETRFECYVSGMESQAFSCRCLRLSRAVGSGDPSSHPDGAQKVVANVLVERHQAMALAVEAQGPKRLG